jgi:hypothetical protein
MIRCTECGEDRDENEFYKRKDRPSGRRSQCKHCDRARLAKWQGANRVAYNKLCMDGRRRARDAQTLLMAEYFKTHPCVDCGVTDPRVLEFDHRDPSTKSFSIGAVKARYTWDRMLEEIAKCDVRCANCHRIRHATERGTYAILGL